MGLNSALNWGRQLLSARETLNSLRLKRWKTIVDTVPRKKVKNAFSYFLLGLQSAAVSFSLFSGKHKPLRIEPFLCKRCVGSEAVVPHAENCCVIVCVWGHLTTSEIGAFQMCPTHTSIAEWPRTKPAMKKIKRIYLDVCHVDSCVMLKHWIWYVCAQLCWKSPSLVCKMSLALSVRITSRFLRHQSENEAPRRSFLNQFQVSWRQICWLPTAGLKALSVAHILWLKTAFCETFVAVRNRVVSDHCNGRYESWQTVVV